MTSSNPRVGPAFFVPDGNGGQLLADEAVDVYDNYRHQIETASYWSKTFTARRVYEVISDHNGERWTTRVGDVTDMRRCIIAILHSIDEHGRSRYVACSLLGSLIHIDATKVRSSIDFADN